MDIRHYHLRSRDQRWIRQDASGEDAILVWHDIRLEESGEDLQNLGAYLSSLNADPEAVAACMLPVSFPDVDVSGGCVFLRFPMRRQWNSPKADYVMLLCMKGVLVSMGAADTPLFDRTLQRLQNGGELAEPSSQAPLFFIMDLCTDISTRQYMAARSAVEALADRI